MIHIKQRPHRADAAEINIINEKTDRWIRCALILIQFTDAADLKVPGSIGVTRPVQVGHHGDHIFEMLLTSGSQRGCIQYRDAGRHLDGGLISQQGCGYNHFLQSIAVIGVGYPDANRNE